MPSAHKRRIRGQVQALSLLALTLAVVAVLGPWLELFGVAAGLAGAAAAWRYAVTYRNAMIADVGL